MHIPVPVDKWSFARFANMQETSGVRDAVWGPRTACMAGLGRETLMEDLTMASLLFRPLNTGCLCKRRFWWEEALAPELISMRKAERGLCNEQSLSLCGMRNNLLSQ